MRLYCTNLVKKYGARTVVRGVSFEVEQLVEKCNAAVEEDDNRAYKAKWWQDLP